MGLFFILLLAAGFFGIFLLTVESESFNEYLTGMAGAKLVKPRVAILMSVSPKICLLEVP